MCTLIPIDTTNLCALNKGEYPPVSQPMPGFCSIPQATGFREQYCAMMSSGGEFANPTIFPTPEFCAIYSCIPYQEVLDSSCCAGCCGIFNGNHLWCQRVSFTGDPVQCCLNDMACSNVDPSANPAVCYSDPGKQHACSNGVSTDGSFVPNYRSIVSTDCQDVLLQYCTGTLPTDDPSSTEWLNRWTVGGNRSCSHAIARNLFRTGNTGPICFVPPITSGFCNINPPLLYNAEGYIWSQQVINLSLKRYEQQGFRIGSLPGFPGYNPWQDFIYNTVCCPYGICSSALTDICADKTSQRISLNPTLASWCGCHLPGGEYQDYSVRFNIPPQCTPMCNRVGTIPTVGINGEAVNCEQSVCLIDGVTVNLINSTIGGGLNFNQVCANCPNANCSCIVSNTTVDIANSTIGGNLVPINQGCGSFTCGQTNPGDTGPTNITVPCGQTVNPFAEYQAEVEAAKQQALKTSWLWTLVIVGVGLLLIFLIIFFIVPVTFISTTESPIATVIPVTTVTPVQTIPQISILSPTPRSSITI